MASYPYKFLVIVLSAVLSLSAASLQLVNDGSCKSITQVQNYLKGQVPADAMESTTSIINFIDCTASNSGQNICNQILSSSIEARQNAIIMDVTSSAVATYSTFENIYNSKFSATQVAEFCKRLKKSATCIIMTDESLQDTLTAYDQILRRFLQNDDGPPVRIGFLVDVTRDSTVASLSDDIIRYLLDNEIILDGQQNLISVMTMKSSESDSSDANRSLLDFCSESKIPYSEISENLVNTWNTVTSSPIKPVLSNVAKEALLKVESAYTAGLVYVESVLNEWHNRVGSGKIVSKFGKRAQELFETSQNKFRSRTMGVVTAREKAEKSRLLVETVLVSVKTLFTQQVAILESASLNNFRKLLKAQVVDDKPLSAEKNQQMLRQAVFDFQTKVTDLEIPTFGLTLDSLKSDIASTLETMLAEFPESSIAKLEALKKMGKQVNNPKKKGRSVNVAMTMVGMIRPPGYGNLQGYFNYATAFGNLPVDFLFGIQNDGDSPEIVGEDREYPLLRLQPKFNFDIDL